MYRPTMSYKLARSQAAKDAADKEAADKEAADVDQQKKKGEDLVNNIPQLFVKIKSIFTEAILSDRQRELLELLTELSEKIKEGRDGKKSDPIKGKELTVRNRINSYIASIAAGSELGVDTNSVYFGGISLDFIRHLDEFRCTVLVVNPSLATQGELENLRLKANGFAGNFAKYTRRLSAASVDQRIIDLLKSQAAKPINDARAQALLKEVAPLMLLVNSFYQNLSRFLRQYSVALSDKFSLALEEKIGAAAVIRRP